MTAAKTKAPERPETMTIKLRKPITLGDGVDAITYSEMTLREPTAGEWLRWDGLDKVASNLKCVEVVSGWPEIVVKQIPVTEFMQAVDFIADFFG